MHSCDYCVGELKGCHKLTWVHGRDSKECCFCNSSLNQIELKVMIDKDTYDEFIHWMECRDMGDSLDKEVMSGMDCLMAEYPCNHGPFQIPTKDN